MSRCHADVMRGSHLSVSQLGFDVAQFLGVALQYLPLLGQCHIYIFHLRYMHHGSETININEYIIYLTSNYVFDYF